MSTHVWTSCEVTDSDGDKITFEPTEDGTGPEFLQVELETGGATSVNIEKDDARGLAAYLIEWADQAKP